MSSRASRENGTSSRRRSHDAAAPEQRLVGSGPDAGLGGGDGTHALLDVYTDRFGKMPTVGSVLRALPDPADHPIFRITTSRPAETPVHSAG
jgi:hypothetical protein